MLAVVDLNLMPMQKKQGLEMQHWKEEEAELRDFLYFWFTGWVKSNFLGPTLTHSKGQLISQCPFGVCKGFLP